jgi:hypothetical protein
MAKMIYGKPTDNIADLVVPVASNADPSYGVANLVDRNPAKPFKMTSTTGNVVWGFGTPKELDIVSLIHTNLTAGLNVRIQGNATDTWAGPTLDEAFTIPARDGDNFPVNPFLDLTGIVSRSFEWWRLVVVGVNAANVSIGDIWLGQNKRSLPHNYSWGFKRNAKRPIIEHRTDYQVSMIYDLGTKIRTLTGEIETNDAGLLALQAWWDSCNGRAQGTLIIPDPAVNDAWLARWATTERPEQHEFKNNNTFPVQWEEISRGLVP